MKLQKKSMILTMMVMCFFNMTGAQDADTTQPEGIRFKVSANYNSNLNYFGRTDSLKSSGFFPMAEVWFTPELYVNAAPIFVSNALQSFAYAGTVATAGYAFNAKDKWLGNIYVLKPFYQQEARLVQAALSLQTGASMTFMNPVLNLTLGGDIKFGEQQDYGATAGVDHIIRIPAGEGKGLVINPSAYAYAGTQQFSNTYYRKRNNLPLLPGREERVTESGTRFNILAYEVSMPVMFSTGKLLLTATPNYILPQNLMTDNDQPELNEQGSNTFYMTLGAKWTF